VSEENFTCLNSAKQELVNVGMAEDKLMWLQSAKQDGGCRRIFM
jgi:hypothetical protein